MTILENLQRHLADRTEKSGKRPNVLIIVADDLGWSDVGCFGGEIHTPNLDRLSKTGLRMTNFHTASMCSPTRSMLLSGTDNHIAGVGQMEFYGRKSAPWKQLPGYEGYLNDRVAPVSEILQDNGYYTTLAGKWHLGLTPDRIPHARGFERSFALLPGGANHYAYEPKDAKGRDIFAHWASLYYEDTTRIPSSTFPKDYYSSDYFTSKLLAFLKEKKEDEVKKEKPFFAMLTFTAPHWPLQAPPQIVKKYDGVYDDGPDALREKRLKRQIELGLLSPSVEPHEVVASTKEWDDMTPSEKRWSAKTMEIFAAMVERLDWNVGRVLDYLKAAGDFEDTFIVFMSDNGAEGAVIEAIPMTGEVIKQSINKHYDNSLENLGNGDSFIWYGPRWAQAATAPSAMHKGYVTEGGIRCPAIIHYPPFFKNKAEFQTTNAFTTVMDILPTVLELARVPLPGPKFRGRDVVPVKGRSWVSHLSGQREEVHDHETVTGWELFFHQAIRKGDWKAIWIPKPKGNEKWQLYNVARDMGEVHDLAEQEPEILNVLVRHWMAYVAEFGVFTKEDLEPGFVLPKL